MTALGGCPLVYSSHGIDKGLQIFQKPYIYEALWILSKQRKYPYFKWDDLKLLAPLCLENMELE